MSGEYAECKPPPRLRDYPYVVVRITCGYCRREGVYFLATLAERYGAKCALDTLLEEVARSAGCGAPMPWKLRKRRKMQVVCHISLPDWDRRPRPPDMPPDLGLRLVVDNGPDEAA